MTMGKRALKHIWEALTLLKLFPDFTELSICFVAQLKLKSILGTVKCFSFSLYLT